MLYQSSMERKNVVKLKRTQLFYLVIKSTKPFAIPKACTRWKTKRGIDIKFFRDDRARLSSAGPEISAFVSHCFTNFQLILDCIVPNLKCKYSRFQLTSNQTSGVFFFIYFFFKDLFDQDWFGRIKDFKSVSFTSALCSNHCKLLRSHYKHLSTQTIRFSFA